MRFTTNIQNNDAFFTDLNGFQVLLMSFDTILLIFFKMFLMRHAPHPYSIQTRALSTIVVDATSQDVNKASLASKLLSNA